MTHPVLASGRPAALADAAPAGPRLRSLRRGGPAAAPTERWLADARRFTYQLPLGMAPRPLLGRDRLRYHEAEAQLEQALWRVAATAGVVVSIDEPAPALARRLARSRAIVPPAAEAVATLVPVLSAGAAGELADASLEPAATKVAERLMGYLASRV